MISRLRFPLLLALAALALQAEGHPELEAVRAEPDMERRSRRALEFAQAQLRTATLAFQAGEVGAGRQALEGICEAVDLAVASLEATGKHPRRHPRHFKRAEIGTRKLRQQLERARSEALIQDQPDFEKAVQRVDAANAKLLLGIMSSGK